VVSLHPYSEDVRSIVLDDLSQHLGTLLGGITSQNVEVQEAFEGSVEKLQDRF